MILNFAGIAVFAASGRRHGIFATAAAAASCATFGSITYVAFDHLFPQWIGLAVVTVWATALRLAAMIFHWCLPPGRAN
jgi:uncharacterized membrane protein YeiH